MRLLIITQKVDRNDPILGFFHRWIEEFSKHCEKLTVICLEEGEHDFNKNAVPRSELRFTTGVKVLSLGKEDSVGRLEYVKRFYKYITQERKNYDSVFVHMNPEYVVLGAPLWKIWNKKISLWYTHRNVDLKLRIAEFFVDKIFTVAKESFQLKTDKLNIVGHGIPVEDFKNPNTESGNISDEIRIISVGRITPIKNLDVLINTAKILKDKGVNCKVKLVGSPTEKGDQIYAEKLKKMVSEFGLENQITFVGSVSNNEIKKYYWESNISINLAPTGGVDKAVLESMAAGLIVLASNKAFEDYFGKHKDALMFKEGDSVGLAEKITGLLDGQNLTDIRNDLLVSVSEKASLNSLIEKVAKELE